jgi:hypothetical protein
MMPPERLYVGREKRVYEEARRLAGCISGSSLGRGCPRVGPEEGYVSRWHGCHSWLVGGQLFEESEEICRLR